jgi:hypothetical protein
MKVEGGGVPKSSWRDFKRGAGVEGEEERREAL